MLGRLSLVAVSLLWAGSASAASLAIGGACPGVMSLDITGATPNGALVVVSGNAGGQAQVPVGPCAGTRLDIGAPTLRVQTTANAQGAKQLTPNVPAGACASSVQVLDVATCTTTKAVPLTPACTVPSNTVVAAGPSPNPPAMTDPVYFGVRTEANVDSGLRTDFNFTNAMLGDIPASASVVFDLYDVNFVNLCSITYDISSAVADPAYTATDVAGGAVASVDAVTVLLANGNSTCGPVAPATWGFYDLRDYFNGNWSMGISPASASMVAALQPAVVAAGLYWAVDWAPYVYSESVGTTGTPGVEVNYAFQYDRTCDSVPYDMNGLLIGPLAKPAGPLSEHHASSAFYVFAM